MVNSIIKWWRDKNVTTKEDLLNVLNNFQILFSTNSTSIEGNVVTYQNVRDIFISGKVNNYTGPVIDLIEIINQKRAFDFLASKFEQREPISIEFILKLHKILLRDCFTEEAIAKGERPGTFKVHDYCVGTTDVGVEPEYVVEDLEELLEEINEPNNDVLMTATYFHAIFESIHPFADGNGRVGRTLMNYFLILNNYPPIVLNSNEKETYYMALEVYNRTCDLRGFRLFLEEQLIKTWGHKLDKGCSSLQAYLDANFANELRQVVPNSFKNLSDTELINMFGEMYVKFKQN